MHTHTHTYTPGSPITLTTDTAALLALALLSTTIIMVCCLFFFSSGGSAFEGAVSLLPSVIFSPWTEVIGSVVLLTVGTFWCLQTMARRRVPALTTTWSSWYFFDQAGNVTIQTVTPVFFRLMKGDARVPARA